MKRTHVPDLPWTERRSPAGRFHVFRRNLSIALGGVRDVGEWGGGHPFDVEEFRVPPGTANFPYHSHAAQWEFYHVTRGSGSVRTADGEQPIMAGDAFICQPGDAHQIINTGAEELAYLVIADHPRADVFHYPDSGKWGMKPQTDFFEKVPKEYFDGEE